MHTRHVTGLQHIPPAVRDEPVILDEKGRSIQVREPRLLFKGARYTLEAADVRSAPISLFAGRR